MKASSATLPMPAGAALRKLGRELALARRRRRISTADMAARVFVSRDTIWRLEKGDPSVSIGTLATTAFILRMHERLGEVAAPASDQLGLEFEKEQLPQRIRRART